MSTSTNSIVEEIQKIRQELFQQSGSTHADFQSMMRDVTAELEATGWTFADLQRTNAPAHELELLQRS